MIAVLAFVAVLSGCSDKNEAANSSPGGSSGASSEATSSSSPVASEQPANGTEAEALPIVSEPLTLTYFTQLAANAAPVVKDYNEIAAYQELEKRTGIHIEWKHPVAGQEAQQLSLMMASGNPTDIIEYNWTDGYPGGAAKAIAEGNAIRLNELIDQYAPNFKKLLEEHPEYKKMITNDDGDIYAFPFLRGDPSLLTSAGLWIRQDWLDKLGLKMPVTVEDWHTVLKAFKEQDPNGNGKADELPFNFGQPNANKFWFDRTSAFIGAWGIGTGFYQENSQVKYGAIQPEFKSFLQTLQTWYKEGLIDPDYALTDSKAMDAKITGNLLGAGFASIGGGIGRLYQLMADIDPSYKVLGAPLPVLEEGDTLQLMQRDFPYTGLGASITAANKHPIETVKWMDYKYGEAGSLLMNFGIEGVSYNMVDGNPQYTEAVTKAPDNLSFAQALSKYALPAANGAFVQDKRYFDQFAGLPIQQESMKNWMQGGTEKMMPPVSVTADESARFASVMNDVNTYIAEMFDKFVMGSEPIENFDKYVKTLKSMGIDDAISIEQAALDRYNSRP
ncbi:extracellular solute-binding protein [Cohnella fermenti]|uniref:Extracellular solute-binding protein n=2 Tax=Cohnella fermenti TaxID=2565925 RepID=A0A4S4BUX2_9BACL|nr:extracellular solute-binding protein [Cohnella fermenti]THF76754.1 extracellular solute-binding protein [Cohnella fermenti]